MVTYTCDLGFELIGDTMTTCTLMDMDSVVLQPTLPFCRREYIVSTIIVECSYNINHQCISVCTCMSMR